MKSPLADVQVDGGQYDFAGVKGHVRAALEVCTLLYVWTTCISGLVQVDRVQIREGKDGGKGSVGDPKEEPDPPLLLGFLLYFCSFFSVTLQT